VTPSSPTTRTGTSTSDAVRIDPRLTAAITHVVQLVLEQQEQRAVGHEADAVVRQARPSRPAWRRLYDIPGAADQLSLSEAKVWALIKAGRLRPGKVDGRTVVTAAELDRFAAEGVRRA
jgi:hypothetical protein